jgi:hypothetical protein
METVALTIAQQVMASSRRAEGVSMLRKNACMRAEDDSGVRRSQIPSVLNNLGFHSLHEVGIC